MSAAKNEKPAEVKAEEEPAWVFAYGVICLAVGVMLGTCMLDIKKNSTEFAQSRPPPRDILEIIDIVYKDMFKLFGPLVICIADLAPYLFVVAAIVSLLVNLVIAVYMMIHQEYYEQRAAEIKAQIREWICERIRNACVNVIVKTRPERRKKQTKKVIESTAEEPTVEKPAIEEPIAEEPTIESVE